MSHQYVANDALRARLRERGLKVGGGRQDLLQRCVEHGLVTDYERLAARNATDSRRAWLQHELALVGCELRTDSRLCDEYIEHGWHDARAVASVMAEMRFLHAHTEYAAIRESIYEAARAEFECDLERWEASREHGYGHSYYERPRFREYFDGDSASATARSEAFSRWLAAQPSAEDAHRHPELPAALKARVVRAAFEAQLTAWLSERVRPPGSVACAVRHTATQLAEASHLLSHYSPQGLTQDALEAQLGAAVRARMAEIMAKERRENLVSGAMRSMPPMSESARPLAQGALVKFGPAPRVVQSVRQALQALSEAQDRLSYADVDRGRRAYLQWYCDLCSYRGCAIGVHDHSRARHGAQSHKHVRAHALRPNPAVSERDVFESAFRTAYVRQLARTIAARRIQRCWRHVSACPEYLVCKRRLLREAAELSTLT